MSKGRLDYAVSWWLGSQLDELAKHAGSGRQRERAYAKAMLAVDQAKARLEKLTREKVGTARLHAAGDLSAAEYRSALAENEAEAAAAHEALVEAQADVPLAPIGDAIETLIKFGEETHDDAAQFNVLLAKVIDRVEVTKETVTIYPVTGKPNVVPRL